MSRSLSSMTRLSHTQRRDNSLSGSLQGATLRIAAVGTVTHDDHDELNEGPDARDEHTDDGHGQDQLDDTLGGIAQVEVVDTEDSDEERQEQRDDPLLGRGRVSTLTKGELAVSRLAKGRLAVSRLAIDGLLRTRGGVGLVVTGGRGLGEAGSIRRGHRVLILRVEGVGRRHN